MAKNVAAGRVPADDMERAIAFYVEKLDLEVSKQTDEWSEIDAGNLTVGLNARERTAR